MQTHGSVATIFLSLFLASSQVTDSKAQNTIEGKVLEAPTGTPIENVHIRTVSAEKGTKSGPEGAFELEVREGADSLLLTHIAYKDQKVPLKRDEKMKVRLTPQPRSTKSVTIKGEKGIDREFTTISKLGSPSYEIPSTYDRVSKEAIEERQADQLTDAMKNATGIRPLNRYGGFQTFTVRGFNDFLVLTDGVRDERHNLSSSAPNSNLAGVERIEVLKGPSSALYGHSALGGVMNVVRKKPTDHHQGAFSLTAGSFDRKRVKAGAGGPISEELSYRIDAGLSDKTGWRNFSQTRAHSYFALNYEPTEKDELSFRGSVSKDRYNTDSGIPTVGGEVPEDMDLSTRYNDPQDFHRFEQYNFQLRYTHKFNDKLKISEQFSYVYDDIENSQGEGLSLTEDRDSVHKTFYLHFNHVTTPIHNRVELNYQDSIGPVEQELVAGYSLGMLDRSTYLGLAFGSPISSLSMRNPQNNQGPVDVPFSQVQVKEEQFHGFYLQDLLSPFPRLKVLLGVRYDLFEGRYRTDRTKGRQVIEKGTSSEKSSGNSSFKAGAVYSLSDRFKLFASYSDHFQPSRTINRNNEILDPVSGYQYEGGLKILPWSGFRAHITGFRIRKKNMISSIGNGRYDQISSAVSTGGEIDLSGPLSPSFHLSGGYSYTDARIDEYSEEASGELEGKQLRFSPKHMANLWVTYGPPKGKLKGLKISAGGNYFGDSYSDRANEILLPAYYVLDASVSYTFGKSTLRFTLKNLTNERYFESAILGSQFYPGAPRNFLVSFSHDL